MIKKFLSVFAILGMMLSIHACKDYLSVSFSTTITMKMNIDVEDDAKVNLYPFTYTDVLDIADDKDIENHINRLKDIDVSEIKCSLSNIPNGESILELTVDIEEIGLSVTIYDIDQNSTIVLPISNEMLEALGNFFLDYHKISVTVSGISTYAPFVLEAELSLLTNIKAGL